MRLEVSFSQEPKNSYESSEFPVFWVLKLVPGVNS